MSKPKIRFKGYEEDWEQRKLSKVAKYRNGKAHENSIAENGKYIVVNSKFVSTDGRVRKFSNEQIEPLYKGEIAFVLSDVPNGRAIARTFLVDKDGKYTLNQRIAGITPYENTDSYFLHILMNRNRYFLKFDDGNKQTNLSVNDVTNFEEKYPSYEEQYKIGQCFSNLDHLITLHQRKCEETKKLKKYMLQKMFPQNRKRVPEIRFAGFTDDWEQRKLKETIEYIVDNRGKNPDYYCSEGIPVIDNFMIRNSLYPDLNTATRFIDENLYQNFIRKYNEEDDILLTLVGNGIGNITLFPKDKAVIIQNTLGFRAKEDKKFLFFLLMANNEALVKLDRGMAQPSIRQDEILDLDIYVPSNSEQIQIGEYFTYLDNLITLHQRKYEELQKIKKFMLQNMFI